MNQGKQPAIVSMKQTDVFDVAEQFVLCYYNMMHESPNQLHRFYQESSSMIYDSNPVFGQKSIHDKFMELKLFNSGVQVHVLQLDALKAYDKIVIQVAGEIQANDSEWRRFMQTFVLGEVSHNDFFVMTDIFRFQDRVFHDTIVKDQQVPVGTPNKAPNATLQSMLAGHPPQPPEMKPEQVLKETAPKSAPAPVKPAPHQNGMDKVHHAEPQMLPVGHKTHPAVGVPEKVVQPAKPANPIVEPQQPSAPKSWAQMASNGAASRPRPSEPVPQSTIQSDHNNEQTHQSNRGNERTNSGRGGMRNRQNFGDREHPEGRGDGHSASRGGYMRGGGGPRNTQRGGAIPVGGGNRRN